MRLFYFSSIKKNLLGILGLIIGFVSLFGMSHAEAVPVFDITTSTTSVTVAPGGTTNITYTVRNNSGINMPRMRSYPPALTTITSGSDCGNLLLNNASCTIVLLFTAPNEEGELTLGPLGVCGEGGRVCSVPNSRNRVSVTVSSSTAVVENIIASGSYQSTTLLFPLLAQSADGATWSYPASIVSNRPADFSNDAILLGTSCSGALCVTVGDYTNTLGDTFPLLAVNNDAGATWTYPASIFTFPADFNNYAVLGSVSCSSSSLCVASGAYTSSDAGTPSKPLAAVSTDQGATWTYSASVTTALPADYDNLFSFTAKVSCSGSLCALVGHYRSTNAGNPTLPLVGVSSDSGTTWTYPASVISGLPADFGGNFSSMDGGASCSGSVCIAGGQYGTTGGGFKPLLTASTNSGTTWSSPASITSALPADYNNNGLFNAVSCSGSICIAGGSYQSTDAGNPVKPLLAVSIDGGIIWSYPAAISSALPSDFRGGGVFRATSCSGNICIAAGFYQSTDAGNPQKPLLVVSTDGGVTWTYPASITSPAVLPSDFFRNGFLYGAECNGSICLAGGEYQSTDAGNPTKPLLVISTDSGVTWTYPTSITTALPADYVTSGLFNATSIGVSATKKPP